MFKQDNGLGVAELPPMAKKKRKPPQEIILTYKADPQTAGPFKEWLDELAAHVGAPVTVTVDMALKEFASSRKFGKVMPKRLVK